MPRTKQRTPELQARVLALAQALLARDGVAGFTTRRVAEAAGTSTPALYELFGDKGGLVRAMYFEGFAMLRRHLDQETGTGDPRADLLALLGRYRDFLTEHPVLAQVMLSRPFTDFDPGPAEIEASSSVRHYIVEHVHRAIEAGVLGGDPTDVAHVVVATVQGMAAAENARRLGTTGESVDRRWGLATRVLLDGLRP